MELKQGQVDNAEKRLLDVLKVNPGHKSANELLGIVPYADRGRYSNEFIEVLKCLWTEPNASYAGEFFNFTDLITAPKPTQQPHPPILTGGNRPPALRRAGRLADGWHGLGLNPESVRTRLPTINAEAASGGRMPLEQIQLRLDLGQLTPEKANDFAAAGVTDLVLSLSSGDIEENRRALQQIADTYL